MKKRNCKFLYTIIVFFMLVLLTTCEKELESPRADFTINLINPDTEDLVKITSDPIVVDVYQNVVFKSTGQGKHVSFWPGDEEHMYDGLGKHKGIGANEDGEVEYEYEIPGSYAVTMVKSNYKYEKGIKYDYMKKSITVNEIDELK